MPDFLTLFDSQEDHEIISEEEFGRILAPLARQGEGVEQTCESEV